MTLAEGPPVSAVAVTHRPSVIIWNTRGVVGRD